MVHEAAELQKRAFYRIGLPISHTFWTGHFSAEVQNIPFGSFVDEIVLH